MNKSAHWKASTSHIMKQYTSVRTIIILFGLLRTNIHYKEVNTFDWHLQVNRMIRENFYGLQLPKYLLIDVPVAVYRCTYTCLQMYLYPFTDVSLSITVYRLPITIYRSDYTCLQIYPKLLTDIPVTVYKHTCNCLPVTPIIPRSSSKSSVSSIMAGLSPIWRWMKNSL